MIHNAMNAMVDDQINRHDDVTIGILSVGCHFCTEIVMNTERFVHWYPNVPFHKGFGE